jgi:hypothetical protein
VPVACSTGMFAEHLLRDPLFHEASALAAGRSILEERCGLNLFLIFRFFLSTLPQGNIIEFGSYGGGSAIFMGADGSRIRWRRCNGMQVDSGLRTLTATSIRPWHLPTKKFGISWSREAV